MAFYLISSQTARSPLIVVLGFSPRGPAFPAFWRHAEDQPYQAPGTRSIVSFAGV